MSSARRAILIVIDGLGIGRAHDQASYGDEGSNTLGNVLARAESVLGAPVALPNLTRLGLGGCARLTGVPAISAPRGAFGTAQPVSPGKDSTTGHWELAGLVLPAPFPTFPEGFPAELLDQFTRETGRGVLGNRPASGTAIIDELAAEQRATGQWIVYTSADSVFQVAAHEEVIPLEELYAGCEAARRLCAGPYGVSRVIARPFVGEPGGYRRTPRRKDFSLPPVGPTLLDRLLEARIDRVGVGKVDDLFAGRGIFSTHTETNAEAYALIQRTMGELSGGLVFANVIEFDQAWGHRNDVPGFLGGLSELDRAVGEIVGAAREGDLVIFTADHGNDPTTPSTDHSRERVPVLVAGPRVRPGPIGERRSFADVGQTVAEFFGVAPLLAGESFLEAVWRG